MTNARAECHEIRNMLLALAAASSLEQPMPPPVVKHLFDCESCRLYADGLRTAPILFGEASLYRPAIKWRSLAAVAGSNSGGDFRLGFVLALPVALSLLMSFLIQVYLVDLALSKVLSTGPLLWALSFGAVWTLGAGAGGLCLTVLLRHHAQDKRFQEVSHDQR